MSSPRTLLSQFLNGTSVEAIRDAREQFLQLGPEAVLSLLEALEERLDYVRTFPGAGSQAIRLVELLVELDSPRALLPLLQLSALQILPLAQNQAFFERMERRASDSDIGELLSILASPPSQSKLPSGLTALRADLLQVAETLVRIAERNPRIELRPALELLKPGLNTPLEYFALHRRLRTALGRGALPIPASSSLQQVDLPIPTEDEVP